jgi:hypothetical protein
MDFIYCYLLEISAKIHNHYFNFVLLYVFKAIIFYLFYRNVNVTVCRLST